MSTRVMSATTRTASSRTLRQSGALLAAGELVHSIESGVAYRIERPLGAGGFGQA